MQCMPPRHIGRASTGPRGEGRGSGDPSCNVQLPYKAWLVEKLLCTMYHDTRYSVGLSWPPLFQVGSKNTFGLPTFNVYTACLFPRLGPLRTQNWHVFVLQSTTTEHGLLHLSLTPHTHTFKYLPRSIPPATIQAHVFCWSSYLAKIKLL